MECIYSEVIYCNFSNDALTLLEPFQGIPKLPPPGIPQNKWPGSNHSRGLPEGWVGTQLDGNIVFVQAILAGEWHARAPGETRVRPHIGSAVSFYDPALTSLHANRRGVQRSEHRLVGISKEDAQAKVGEIEDVLRAWRDGDEFKGSGADWASAMTQVEERHSSRLLELNDTLHSTSYPNASSQATTIRRDVLIMISPHLASADVASSSANSTSWLDVPMARCSIFATSGIRAAFSGRFTTQELLILDAIEGTQSAICRVIGLLWLDAFGVETADEASASALILQWRTLVDDLLVWLDWTSFRACRPGCAVNVRIHSSSYSYRSDTYATQEICYVTTWPFVLTGDDPNDFDYTPRCISTHATRRTDDPPNWPPVPPGGNDSDVEGLMESMLGRAKRRRGLDV